MGAGTAATKNGCLRCQSVHHAPLLAVLCACGKHLVMAIRYELPAVDASFPSQASPQQQVWVALLAFMAQMPQAAARLAAMGWNPLATRRGRSMCSQCLAQAPGRALGPEYVPCSCWTR